MFILICVYRFYYHDFCFKCVFLSLSHSFTPHFSLSHFLKRYQMTTTMTTALFEEEEKLCQRRQRRYDNYISWLNLFFSQWLPILFEKKSLFISAYFYVNNWHLFIIVWERNWGKVYYENCDWVVKIWIRCRFDFLSTHKKRDFSFSFAFKEIFVIIFEVFLSPYINFSSFSFPLVNCFFW